MIHNKPVGLMHQASLGSSESQAILLCAGLGKRLLPVTRDVPKQLIEVGGQTLLDWHLASLAAAGVRSVVLVVGHLEESIRDHASKTHPPELEIEFVRQERLIGTGEGLRCAVPHIWTPWFYLGYGDVFFDPEENIWERLGNDQVARMAGARVANGGSYGRLIVRDVEGRLRLTGIAEKDGRATPGIVNAGAYFLPREILPELDRLVPSSRGELEFTDAITRFVNRGNVVEVILAKGWTDVGTLESLQQAKRLARRT